MIYEPGLQSCGSLLRQNLYQYPSIISFLLPVGPIHRVTKWWNKLLFSNSRKNCRPQRIVGGVPAHKIQT